MPKGNPGGNPEVLVAAAEAKKKDAEERTEKAITALVKSGAEITFESVAQEAGVSVPYLYKYEELKERIKQLRDQQKQAKRKRSKKPQSFQPASDKSKAVLIYNLKEDNKRLRSEIDEHRRHIEVVQGRLYELGAVAEENHRLRQQLEKITEELQQTRQKLDEYLLAHPTANPKVTAINAKRQLVTPASKDEPEEDAGREELKERLQRIGVRLNAPLQKIMDSKTDEEVSNAVSAVEEYLTTGKKVKSKAGLFRKALSENWEPNLTDEERNLSQASDDFVEWFDLAKTQGIVQASQGTKDGILVLETTGHWTKFADLVDKGWTLEYLRERSRR